MNNKDFHQKVSEILAKVIDLPYEEGLRKIDQFCAEDALLKKEVVSLYDEMQEEDSKEVAPSIHKVKDKTKLVGRKDSVFRSKVVSNWTKILFGNKRNRLVLVLLFLCILLGAGFISGMYIRNNILDSEREVKKALLATTTEIFERWIINEKNKIQAIALNEELINYAIAIDSLENLDETYELLRSSQVAREATKWFQKEGKRTKYGLISMLSNASPKILLGNSLVDSTGITAQLNEDLGEIIYKDYLKAKNGEIVFIPPVNNYDLVNNFVNVYGENVHREAWVNFLCPIFNKNEQVIAILVGSYQAKYSFSNIFRLSKHGATSETYAFNDVGKMLSSSRFTKELRQTYLLKHDTLAETIYNIELRDPGFDVMDGSIPETKSVEQPYTRIVDLALNKLATGDTTYSGDLMTPYRDYRGIEVIGASVWLPEYNFGVITEEDYTEALASLVYFKYTFASFFIVILVLSFLLFNSNVRIARIGKKVEDFSILGQYKLREKIGEGGFGQVYKAEHTFLKNPVAIKILKSNFVNTDMLDRFEKEVKITSSLSHPNTIKVYDYGITETKDFYYVMEYLNGVSLDKIVNSKNDISVARGVYILYHICLSLKEAHEKGLVHRDIKPMNVMLCNQGGAVDVVKLLDFGLVKEVDATISQQTQINRIGGTPMFMAPERLRDPFNADQRVDIYSIGALGMYLFSGQYLLELVSQKMLSGEETLHGEFRNQLIERKDVPADLRDFLAECIRFDPQKRPAHIDQLIDFFEIKHKEFPWDRHDALKWWKEYDAYS
ncbi:serine/threonine-protein kinase [Lutimonas halocynthiae]|uniref:serine/threonine-protein kinase n=1 Tax=Lutimonas halocynthiae TaxID=1446477 RepID=UPI0025B2F2C1|nr:serine/threonine-protein kinase [Lutimonas halocynthiae]MDN3641300.1 serine/threonine-protein kinase [Lutimonas halocynthiae]